LARRRYRTGCLFIRGKRRKKWIARWHEPTLSNDENIRNVQGSEVIGLVSELSKSKAQDLLNTKLRTINAGSHRPQSTMQFKQFSVESISPPFVERFRFVRLFPKASAVRQKPRAAGGMFR
jgi:hypothetical protein